VLKINKKQQFKAGRTAQNASGARTFSTASAAPSTPWPTLIFDAHNVLVSRVAVLLVLENVGVTRNHVHTVEPEPGAANGVFAVDPLKRQNVPVFASNLDSAVVTRLDVGYVLLALFPPLLHFGSQVFVRAPHHFSRPLVVIKKGLSPAPHAVGDDVAEARFNVIGMEHE